MPCPPKTGRSIPTWSGVRRLFRRQRLLERLLNRVEDTRLILRQVAREVAQESLLGQLAPIACEGSICGCGVRYLIGHIGVVE